MPTAVAVSEQGARARMEDYHTLDFDSGESGSVFGGVYDGHSGNSAARHAAEFLHVYFFDFLRAGLPPATAFQAAYLKISRDLENQPSGTTAATFFIDEGLIHAANAGDSRILVVREEGETQLSVDHRVDNPEEMKRIKLSGGEINYPYVVKGSSGLMPTRALGDEYFRDIGVISVPSVCSREIGPSDLWLVAASDGLFDVIDNRETAGICRLHTDPFRLAETLVGEIAERSLAPDNITIILVKFP